MDEANDRMLYEASLVSEALQREADCETKQKTTGCIFMQIILPDELKAEFDALSNDVREVTKHDERRWTKIILVNELEARIMRCMIDDRDKVDRAIAKKAERELNNQASGLYNAAPLTDEQIAKLSSYHSTLDSILTHLILATAITRVRDKVIALSLEYTGRYSVFELSVLFHRDTD